MVEVGSEVVVVVGLELELGSHSHTRCKRPPSHCATIEA